MRVIQRACTGWPDSIKTPRPARANFGAGPDARVEQPFLFQPGESRLDGAGRHIPLQPLLDFREDRAAIRLFAQPDHRKQNGLFKDTEHAPI